MQLADQFRQSVQAGGAASVVEDGPQDGWFVGVNGVPLGPIPVGDLRELASAGHIDRKSLVWREGQAEWRPLAKFPFLARMLEEASPSASRPLDAPEPPSRGGSNGASATGRGAEAAPAAGAHAGFAPGASSIGGAAANAGLVASGFDAPRPTEPKRPSAWGDLDDDDDDTEQPTTVKGRVSLPPLGPAVGTQGGLPPVPAPPGRADVMAPASSATQHGPASSTAAVSVPPSAGEPDHRPVVSAMPPPEEVAARFRGQGRKRNVTVAVAVALACLLGVAAWHFLSEPGPSSSKPAPGRSMATSGQGESSDKKPEAQQAPPPASDPATSPAEGARPAGEPPIGQIPEPPPAAKVPPSGTPATSAGGSTPPAAAPKAAPSLLSGLNTLQTPGPAAGAKAGGGAAAAGPGLDATAIQRTVRRYSPAVRQNCWQRALNARAPGVPSSAKVTAQIIVEASGKVQSVTASGAPRGYPGLAHCIEDAVKGWTFPRSFGETVTNVPFMFVGQ